MSGVDQLRALVSERFTADVLDDVLKRRSGAEEVAVDAITFADGGTKKGDSYLSILTRFTVDFTAKKSGKSTKHSLHVISKSIPKNVARKKTFRSSVFFNNELVFYDQVWPELNAFQKSKNVKEPLNNIPDFFAGASDGENDYIAMEDLSYKGFGQAERSSGLDIDTVRLIMKSFAKFHAIGLAYKDQHPDKFEKMASKFKEETYFTEKYRNWYKDFSEQCKDIVRHAVKKELNEEYLKKINSLFDGDFYKKLCDCVANRGPLSVITHGDAWIPNFLMKYDESRTRAVETVMIDFQLTRCAPFALDIMFFLYACTKGEFLERHYTEIIRFYHENFVAYLKQLGSSEKLFTYDALLAELKANVAFSVGMAMEAVIVGQLEDDEVTDIDQLQGEEEVPLTSIWVVKPFESQEKRRRVSDFIKHAVDQFL